MDSLATNCISLNDEPCLLKPTLTDLNPNKLHYYPFMVNLDWCNGSCNTLDDLSCIICVPNNTEDVNLNTFHRATKVN